MRNGGNTQKNGNGGNLGFEAEMFKAASKLRGNIEPSHYKHVALGRRSCWAGSCPQPLNQPQLKERYVR